MQIRLVDKASFQKAGYTPDYVHGYFFGYYPEGINGSCELWIPVVKADA